MVDRIYIAALRFFLKKRGKSLANSRLLATNIMFLLEIFLLVAVVYWLSELAEFEVPKIVYLIIAMGIGYYNISRYDVTDLDFRDSKYSLQKSDKAIVIVWVIIIVGTYAHTIVQKVIE